MDEIDAFKHYNKYSLHKLFSHVVALNLLLWIKGDCGCLRVLINQGTESSKA